MKDGNLHFETKIVNVVIRFCPLHTQKVWTNDPNTRRCKKQHHVKDSSVNSATYRYSNKVKKADACKAAVLKDLTNDEDRNIYETDKLIITKC